MRNLSPTVLLTAALWHSALAAPVPAQGQAEPTLYVWPGRVIEYVDTFAGKEKLWAEGDAEKFDGVDVRRIAPTDLLGRPVGPDFEKQLEQLTEKMAKTLGKAPAAAAAGEPLEKEFRIASLGNLHIAMTRPGSYFVGNYKDGPAMARTLLPGFAFRLSALLNRPCRPKSSAGSGLYWGFENKTNYSVFMLHGGRYTAGRVTNGKWQGLEWAVPEPEGCINPTSHNELTVRWNGERIELLLNGHLMHAGSTEDAPLHRELGKYGVFVGNGKGEEAHVFVSDFAVRAFPEKADLAVAERAALMGDYVRAAAHLRVLVEERPDDGARIAFAKLLVRGAGVRRDPGRAARLLAIAAENGNDQARVMLAQLYVQGAGVEQDLGAATALLEKAADGGSDDARLLLADILAHGSPGLRDYPRARRLLEDVASRRSAAAREAEYRLGLLYVEGLGVEVDMATGRKWLERAVDGLFPQIQALYTLGTLHSRGALGQADPGKAIELWQRAADRGEPQSMFALGRAYQQGFGVEADPVEAAKWLAVLVARNRGAPGTASVAQECEKLKAQLSPEDRKRADAMVQAWLQSH